MRDAPLDVVIVGEDFASSRGPVTTLAAVARIAAGAPVLLAFRNRASATALVGTLLGEGEAEGLVPASVERWLTAARGGGAGPHGRARSPAPARSRGSTPSSPPSSRRWRKTAT